MVIRTKLPRASAVVAESPGHETGTGSSPRPTSRWLHGLEGISAGMCLPLWPPYLQEVCDRNAQREESAPARLGELPEGYCWLVSLLGLD